MRKTGMTLRVLGALAGVAVLAGCEDNGRSWAMTAPDDYMSTAGSTEDSGTGGSGIARASAEPRGLENDLWLKQDFRTPYPPAALEAQVAQELGTGKPLRAEKGVWVQGIYAVELASGVTQAVSPSSAPFQPQVPVEGDIAPPRGEALHP
ncbi:MAG: hypothetical protein ABW123_27135 [Cystobacter sp.]